MSAFGLAVFVVVVLASGPAARWLRERPDVRLKTWTVLGLLPFVAAIPVALIFLGATPSDTHGFETMPLIDGLVLSLFRCSRRPDRRLPYWFVFALYFLVVLVSVTQARWPMLAVGYAWTLGRMALLVVTIWRWGNEDPRVVGALLRGMMYGVVYEAGLATWQHFGAGLQRAYGNFSGWNSLGLTVNLVAMVPVARILAGPTSRLMKITPLAALAAGLFSLSRGALLFLGIGVALVWLGSSIKEFTRRKAWFGLGGLLLAAVVVPIALSAMASRAESEREESLETRGRLEAAAALMLREHPWGVGASHYTPELLLGGYGRRAEVGWGVWTSIVHNVYWLTAAELGYAGVVALLLLFLTPLWLALIRRPRGPAGDVLLGLGVGQLLFCVHLCFEWAWRLSQTSYVYFMSVAMVAVLARPSRRRPRRRPPAVPGSDEAGAARSRSAATA